MKLVVTEAGGKPDYERPRFGEKSLPWLDDGKNNDEKTVVDIASLEEKPAKQVGITNRRLNKSFHHYRFFVVVLGGFLGGTMILLRYNITVAILNMVNQTALYLHENPNSTLDDYLAEGYPSEVGEFVWSNEVQHMIMSWYLIAYTLPQVATTKLGLMAGTRLAVFAAISVCAISTILLPISAYWGWQWALAVRLIGGIGASPMIPLLLNLIENWMPYEEISLGLTISKFFQAVAGAAGPLVAGYLCDIHWSYAFYVPGVVAQLLAIAWFLLTTDRPEDNRLISEQELELIRSSNARAQSDNNDNSRNSELNNANTSDVDEPKRKPSMLDILQVPSFYAYVLIWILYSNSLGDFTLILPTYLRQFLKIEVSQAGLYTTIIQIGSILAVLWPHPMLRLIKRHLPGLSATSAQRLVYGLACSATALCWLHVGFFHDDQLPFLFTSRLFHGCTNVVVTGSLMSNYAQAGLSSLAFSIINTVGWCSVVLSSTFIGWLLDQTGQSRAGWSWIFLALGISQLIALLVFGIFVRSGPVNLMPKSTR